VNGERGPVRTLTGCGLVDGHLVACTEEVLPRLKAIERSHRAGQHEAAEALARITDRLILVHLAELESERRPWP
jgi:hypothetical protein